MVQKMQALGILAAAIMTDETVLIENLPDVRDINVLLEAMESIGVKVERITRHAVMMNSAQIGDVSVDYEYIKRIRASYYLIGALLGKYKKAVVPLPGGCNIGSRPIDLHIKGFKAPWRKGGDPQWIYFCKCRASAWKPYLFRYGICRSYD